MTIQEINGTLNVGDSLNVARKLAVKGDLEVTGNVRVQGVAYIPSLAGGAEGAEGAEGSLGSGAGDGGVSGTELQEVRDSLASLAEGLESEVTSRANADTILENAIGAVRRDTEWWLFPVTGGAEAVTTDGTSTVTFAKEGFRFCAGDAVYLIAPPVSAGLSFSFSFGETGYLCMNISRLFRLMPDQRISVAAVMEKITTPSLIHPGTHVPVAYCRGGEMIRLLGHFADIFG